MLQDTTKLLIKMTQKEESVSIPKAHFKPQYFSCKTVSKITKMKSWSPTHLNLMCVYEGKEGFKELIFIPVTLGRHSFDSHI